MAHDGMEVKAEDLVFANRFLRFVNGTLAFEGIDCAPGLPYHARMAIAHLCDVFVGARRRAGNRLDIESDEHRFYARSGEFLNDLGLAFPSPIAVPIFGQRLDIWPLRFDPGLGVGIAVQVDNSQSLPSS